jgi:hypothetical protein
MANVGLEEEMTGDANIDPVFEGALREALAKFAQILRVGAEIAQMAERQRIREILKEYYGNIPEEILEEIGEVKDV